MKIETQLACSECRITLIATGGFNDPRERSYQCPKCKIRIRQHFFVSTDNDKPTLNDWPLIDEQA